MADEEAAETADAADGDEPKKKGGKSKLIIIVLLLVVIGGGAYMFLGGSDSSAAKLPPCKEEVDPMASTTSTEKGATTTAPKCAAEPVPKRGGVLQADPVTLTLKDGSLLKVGIAVQLGEAAVAKTMAEEHGEAAAVHVAMAVLATKNAEELAPGEPREKVQEEISAEVRGYYDPEVVLGVYFTSDFVLQPAG
ncbi:MAG: flagellar basal body-associated FliL family protein [Acidimicrobiia bacterium]